VVEATLLVELETVDRLLPIHEAQVLTYLKLLDLPEALLINVNARLPTEGLRSCIRPAGQNPTR
jgi:GxxExxY protein